MVSIWVLLLRLILAIALGGAIGFEREFHEHRAGMRTNALVSLGSALFTIISAYGFLSLLSLSHVQVDPTRVASYVVAGIGFLGAGTIVIRKGGTQGLTTAASVWTVAAIGMACGVGFYWEAVAVTVLALAVLVVLRFIERLVLPDQLQMTLLIQLEPESTAGELMGQVYDICLQHGLIVETLKAQRGRENTALEIVCRSGKVANALHTLDVLRVLKGVHTGMLDLQGLDRLDRSLRTEQEHLNK